MKFYDVEPRSKEWCHLRLAIPTSSQFERILTPKTMQVSKRAQGYLEELLAEYITGMPITSLSLIGEEPEQYQSQWMVRGQDTEDAIWKAYELYADVETQRGGFFTNDNGTAGCSPDRLVGDDGLLEVKAPALTMQIGYLLSGNLASQYYAQIQGQLLISERAWSDLFAWHPRLFIEPVRVQRDEKFIGVLRSVLESFIEQMLKAREELEAQFGPFVCPEQPAKDEGIAALGISKEDLDAILAAKGLE
jgi:hypothetical protein